MYDVSQTKRSISFRLYILNYSLGSMASRKGKSFLDRYPMYRTTCVVVTVGK